VTLPAVCPTCRSTEAHDAKSGCHNPWHRGIFVHFQREPIGTPHAECHAACAASFDDAPSELAIGWEFVSCPRCLAAAPSCDRVHPAPSCIDPACYREESARKADDILPGLGDLVRKGRLDPDPPADDTRARPVVRKNRELSDIEVNQASLEDLRIAYRALRDHHVTETTALVTLRDDLVKRCEDKLTKSQQILTVGQDLLTSADAIMRRDSETIDQLSAENARLSEIIDFMQNHYSPLGGRACALCVYEDGRFIRSCAIHRWEDAAR